MKDSACGHGLSEDSAVTPPTLSPTGSFPMVSFNVWSWVQFQLDCLVYLVK